MRLIPLRRLSLRPFILPSILIAFTVLGLIYSFVTPIFEAPDESNHFFVIQHIRETGGLPVQQLGVKTPYMQEGSQPPAYYLAGALLTSWIDTSDAPDFIRKNPQANVGRPGEPGNKNRYIHTAREDWPYRGAPLAVHVLRVFSIALALIGIGFTYATVRVILPEHVGLAAFAASIMAFNPQFIFISASVNNDNLMNALAPCGLYVVARAWRGDRSWKNAIAWGLIVAVAMLAKFGGLMLLIFSFGAIGWLMITRREWKWGLRTLAVISVLTLIISGWWYLRNIQLYGELTGTELMLNILGRRTITFSRLISEMPGLWYSMWGVFGWFNMQLADPNLAAYTLLGLGAIVGGVVALIRSRLHFTRSIEPVIALMIWTAMIFAGVIRWTTATTASQGRLMFTAMGALAILFAAGWWSLIRRWRKVGASAISIGMLIVAVYVPFGMIVPAYQLPDRIQLSDVPSNVNPLSIDFNGTIRLIGGSVEPHEAKPGDLVTINLYWQGLRKPDRDYMVFVHLLGRNLELVGNEDAYHGDGLYPSDLWQPGEVIADRYQIRVSDKANAPARVQVEVGLRDRTTQQDVKITESDGADRTDLVVVDQFRLTATNPITSPQRTQQYRIGDVVELIGYDAPQVDQANRVIKYRLYWRVLKPMNEDYTVFAHLLDANGTPIGQGDSEPFNGDYPTSWWQPNEQFVEERSIAAPDRLGDYRVMIGLYQADGGMRLPISDANGNAVPDGQIILK